MRYEKPIITVVSSLLELEEGEWSVRYTSIPSPIPLEVGARGPRGVYHAAGGVVKARGKEPLQQVKQDSKSLPGEATL